MLGDGVRTFAARWDKRERCDPCDLGEIGEDADGVWVRRHPDVLLSDAHDRIGEALSLFALGLVPTIGDYDRLPACTITALNVLRSAADRESIRDARRDA